MDILTWALRAYYAVLVAGFLAWLVGELAKTLRGK